MTKIHRIYVLILLYSLIVLILSFLAGYSQQSFYPYIPTPFTALIVSILGVFLIILDSMKLWERLAFEIVYISIIGICSIISGICSIFVGGFICVLSSLLWLIPVVSRGILIVRKLKTRSDKNKLFSFDVEDSHGSMISQSEQTQLKPQLQSNKCSICCRSAIRVIITILMMLISAILIINTSNLVQYTPIGKLVELQYSNATAQTVKFHIYCTDNIQTTDKPIIILEHGAGSNLIAFYHLQQQLVKNNFESCSYDRLGYGRSSIGPRNLNPQDKARILNQLLDVVIPNKTIIMGGWSAGVEMAINYYYYYGSRVKGLLAFDGYPDYLRLQAIARNDSSYNVEHPASLMIKLFEYLQPFGAGLSVGSSQISNQTTNNYYKAYYQTGYFWTSQHFDYINPYDLTEWMTNLNTNATIPYPNSKINLNWPDITVPMLIMLANRTVSDSQWGYMFMEQANQYKNKCKNKSEIVVVNGDHGFVMVEWENVGNKIGQFFK